MCSKLIYLIETTFHNGQMVQHKMWEAFLFILISIHETLSLPRFMYGVDSTFQMAFICLFAGIKIILFLRIRPEMKKEITQKFNRNVK